MVLGTTTKDPISELLETGYRQFRSETGIHGLAKTLKRRLDILAIHATRPGTGQFRQFIRKAQAEYRSIYVWEVWNPDLKTALERYGFEPCHDFDRDIGESLDGYLWSRKKRRR